MGDQTVQSNSLIKSIDKISVHKLCSGQVVLTLATAVKELVENSLDAGATNITVRFVRSGLESLEVSDNGSGVDEDNFQALTLKHYTSKIAEFDDLVDVGTYGFRGEALSSLCALSKVTVLTRSGSAEVGTKLCIDNGGKIASKSICPRQQGTTVVVEDLFSTLPVRRKELEKNISREFGRMVNYISGYCLIRLGLKLTITNLVKNNGSTATVLRVSGNSSIKGNIMDVFGMKQWTSLVEFVACNQPDEEVLEELGISTSQDKISSFLHDLTVTGYISSAEHGQGRSSSDRQFFFINQRPFDSQKLSRLINEVYHSFNRNQYPFVVLDVRIARCELILDLFCWMVPGLFRQYYKCA